MILFDLFITFFQIGLFTFGGGYAMIPLITEKTISKGWVAPEQLVDYIAIGESTPGPFSINVATFVGMYQGTELFGNIAGGVLGAVITVAGLVLPSFIIILIIAKFLTRFIEYKGVSAALKGLNPAAIGLILSAAVSIGVTAFNINFSLDFYKYINLPEIIIFAVIFAISRIKKLKFNSYKIIIASAVLGMAFYGVIDLFNINLT